MKVKVIKDYNGLLEGSVIIVKEETETLYKGLWTSMYGSFNTSVEKSFCEIIEE